MCVIATGRITLSPQALQGMVTDLLKVWDTALHQYFRHLYLNVREGGEELLVGLSPRIQRLAFYDG